MEPLTGWQRDLALHVIEQLHLTSPVYLQAPSLAELWSWRAITLTLSPTLPEDEQEHRREVAACGKLGSLLRRVMTRTRARWIPTLRWTPVWA